MKLAPPHGTTRGVDIRTSKGTRKLNQDRSGFIEVTDSKTVAALKAEGFTEVSLMGVATTGKGYPCASCGFGSWFAICGRCGADNG